jgi:hypothetical protein
MALGATRRELIFVAGSGMAMLLIFLMVRGNLVDDAYIALGYARNLALHLHWGLIPHEVSNTATSTLNAVLLGAVTAATRIAGGVHPIFALGVVSVLLAMLMAWGWVRIGRALELPFVVPVLGVALVLINPFLLSAIGLEVLLVPTLLVALVAAALEERVGWFGAFAGLALLTRPDLAVFVVLIAAATPAVRRNLARALVPLALVAAPWPVFSWFYFGSAVPDTFVIKTSQGGLWGIWQFITGPIMFSNVRGGEASAVALAFAPALLGAFLLIGYLMARTSVRWATSDSLPRLGPAAGLGAGGIAHYAAFSLIDPGPYHWYYVPTTTSLSMFLAIALGVWLRHARARPDWRPAVPALALGVAGLIVLGSVARDLRQGVPWRSPLISTNFANPSDYERIGKAVRARVGRATVAGPGEIGALAYYCECDMTDVYSDRGIALDLIKGRIGNAGLLSKQLLELNYELLDRDLKPRHNDYRLAYAPGPGSGRDVWQIQSRWQGVGHLSLIRLSK